MVDKAAESAIYRDAFGDDPDVWAQASPAAHVGSGPLPPRALIVTRDNDVRTSRTQSFGDQLAAAQQLVMCAVVTPARRRGWIQVFT